MIEATIIKYLNNALNIPTYAEVQANPEDLFIVVEKTGSSNVNHIYESTIAVQSYAPTMLRAIGLNESVKQAMLALQDENDDIISVHLNSDYNYTDTTSKKYRYQAVFDVQHYEEV